MALTEKGDKDWMDARIVPMMAGGTREPFNSLDHIFEVKWDGIRALAFLSGRTRLQSRNLRDLSLQYPELSLIHLFADAKEAIIDGEIVSLDERGRPSFERLQSRMNLTRREDIEAVRFQVPVTFVAFDILYLDGRPLVELPLLERRSMLRGLFTPDEEESTRVFVPDFVENDGLTFYRAAIEQGLEGMMAKRKESKYWPGKRTRDWLKVKHLHRQEFVIGGWTEGAGLRAGSFGSLLLGVYEDDQLVFVGHCGTGFDEMWLRRLQPILEEFEIDEPPFRERPVTNTPPHWTRPNLVAEVEFSQWTAEGRLRTPSFKGLRWDKDPRDCVRES